MNTTPYSTQLLVCCFNWARITCMAAPARSDHRVSTAGDQFLPSPLQLVPRPPPLLLLCPLPLPARRRTWAGLAPARQLVDHTLRYSRSRDQQVAALCVCVCVCVCLSCMYVIASILHLPRQVLLLYPDIRAAVRRNVS